MPSAVSRPTLTNDELGHAAEAAFSFLCAQAQLTANKSDRDRTGWDFIVEFPFPDTNPRLPLDEREPTTCRVQLKASVASSRVSLKLSAAERLAKAAGPSMIVAFRMSPSGEVLGGHVVPLVGQNLAKVLRRLRQARVEGRSDLHRMSVSYDARGGQRFNPDPDSLREALSAACGQDPGAYLVEKQRQLAELGYETGRYLIEAAFTAEDPEELLDVFLGLKPVAPTRFEAFDARFGLRLPVAPPPPGRDIEVRIVPEPAGVCTVQVRSPQLLTPAVFPSEVLIAPPIPGVFKLVFRHPDLLVTFSNRELKLETSHALDEGSRRLAEWLNLFRALDMLRSGEGVLVFTGWRFDRPAEFKVSAPLTGPYLDDMPWLVQLVESAQRLIAMAGIAEDPLVSFAQLRGDSHEIRLAADLLLSGTPTAVFTFEVEEADIDDELVYLHAGICGVGAAELGYAMRLTFRRLVGTDRFSSADIAPLDIRPLRRGELNEYAREQADKHDLPCLLDYLETAPNPPLAN